MVVGFSILFSLFILHIRDNFLCSDLLVLYCLAFERPVYFILELISTVQWNLGKEPSSELEISLLKSPSNLF